MDWIKPGQPRDPAACRIKDTLQPLSPILAAAGSRDAGLGHFKTRLFRWRPPAARRAARVTNMFMGERRARTRPAARWNLSGGLGVSSVWRFPPMEGGAVTPDKGEPASEQRKRMLLWSLLFMAALAGAERDVLEQVNAHRKVKGLSALVWHEAAAQEARRHCGRVLAGTARGPHAGFEERAARLRRATGARRAGENVFLQDNGPFVAERAVQAWLKSRGHRRAIEGPFEISGVGLVSRGGRVCAAQIFLGR